MYEKFVNVSFKIKRKEKLIDKKRVMDMDLEKQIRTLLRPKIEHKPYIVFQRWEYILSSEFCLERVSIVTGNG